MSNQAIPLRESSSHDTKDSGCMLLQGLPTDEEKSTPALRRAVATHNIHALTKAISWRVDQGKYSDRNVTSNEDAQKFEQIQSLLENVKAECDKL
jgi:hypothetical protein